MNDRLKGKKIAILATNGFEEVELTKPRKALDEAGATTHIIAPESGTIKAWNHDDWSDTYEVDATLDEASADDYDALVLPGGVLNPDKLRVNEDALAFVKSFFEQDKPVGAICHGPWTLINADVVKGRKLTSYHTIRRDLENAGAIWVDQEVAKAGNLVTSRNPDDIPAFNDAIIEAFSQAGVEIAV
jgi:protease I